MATPARVCLWVLPRFHHGSKLSPRSGRAAATCGRYSRAQERPIAFNASWRPWSDCNLRRSKIRNSLSGAAAIRRRSQVPIASQTNFVRRYDKCSAKQFDIFAEVLAAGRP
jgi:hypothetical protein